MIPKWGEYTQPAQVWTAIPGFFDYEEIYADIASWARDGAVLVEVGSFLGRSACWLGERLQGLGKKVTLLCVDEWPSTYQWGPDLATKIEAPFETFVANVRQSGLLDIIIPIRAKSVRAASFVKNDLDFVWIDAGHEYKDVQEDLNAWLPKVSPAGVIAGHDYDFPGVKQAVDEKFPEGIAVRGRSWVYGGRNRI